MANPDLVDLHPAQRNTVDVAPALSQPLPTDPATARSQAMVLLDLTKQIDLELSHHQSVLAANSIDQHSPLIDSQGFPLADKDLVAIRGARSRIAMLRNDSKAVRERTAKLLELAINGDATTSLPQRSGSASQAADPLTPFARINSVAAGSPAELAGLLEHDLILRFSSITHANSDGLKSLARPGLVVDGQSLVVVVQRGNDASLELTLTPASGWGGRGMLGCHLLPL